jgi:hypothetical protein
MHNFNRDAYQAEHERSEKMYTSASRQVPLHLRIDNGKRFANWLSTSQTAGAISGFASLVRKESARYWRRASSRAAGMAANGVEEILGIAPG